jgi:putative protein-disulfide isomerase
MTARIVYAFDPLCGWCHGFGPALDALRAAFPDVPLDLRLGGLVTGARIGPYAAMGPYIRGASARMTAVTGVPLGAAFFDRILGDSGAVASSIPPCDVLLQARAVDPARVPDLARAMQDAHFTRGADLNDPSVHADLAARLGLDLRPDVPGPHDLRPALAAEFAVTRALGVASYPTVLVTADGRPPRGVDIAYDPATMVGRVAAALGVTSA